MRIDNRLLLIVTSLALFLQSAFADSQTTPATITFLHTNDIHSHFKPEKGPLALGGLARIKTFVDQTRAENPNTLVMDGGDWSEGNIYYALTGGLDAIQMMEHIGYDVAVVGNHDWINGPDLLLDTYSKATGRMKLLAANANTTNYSRAEEFNRLITPYIIREVAGIKIAFIGVLTYDFIYDHYLSPIKINPPHTVVRDLVAKLKKQADVIVAISHNSLGTNQSILKAVPDLDIIIGAHDHKKVFTPIVVQRPGGKPGYLVETGSWGRHVGKMVLKVIPRDQANAQGVRPFSIESYRLVQMDSTIKEDPETASKIEKLETQIEERYGPVFHDDCGESEIEIGREVHPESMIGNLMTDAYRNVTGADIAVDEVHLIYGALHAGKFTTADMFNANPAIFDPRTGRGWTVKVFKATGRTLNWMLNVVSLLNGSGVTQKGLPSLSGVKIVYDNLNFKDDTLPGIGAMTISPMSITEINGGLSAMTINAPIPRLPALGNLSIHSTAAGNSSLFPELRVGDDLLDENKTYKVASSNGIYEALQFLNNTLPGAVPISDVEDTGLEHWRMLKDYVQSISPITADKISFGSRMQSAKADLGVMDHLARWEILENLGGRAVRVRFTIPVTNFGAQTSEKPALLHIAVNRNGSDLGAQSDLRDIAAPQNVATLQSGQSTELFWEVVLPVDRGIAGATFYLTGTDEEANQSNDSAPVWFSVPAPQSN